MLLDATTKHLDSTQGLYSWASLALLALYSILLHCLLHLQVHSLLILWTSNFIDQTRTGPVHKS